MALQEYRNPRFLCHAFENIVFNCVAIKDKIFIPSWTLKRISY